MIVPSWMRLIKRFAGYFRKYPTSPRTISSRSSRFLIIPRLPALIPKIFLTRVFSRRLKTAASYRNSTAAGKNDSGRVTSRRPRAMRSRIVHGGQPPGSKPLRSRAMGLDFWRPARLSGKARYDEETRAYNPITSAGFYTQVPARSETRTSVQLGNAFSYGE